MNGKLDLKALVGKLLSRWYIFLIALLVFVPAAWIYLATTDNIYKVRASLLLDAPGQNGMQGEKFMKGMELLGSSNDIEDEIGILKSYHIVGSALRKLAFGISYHEKKQLNTVEVYDKPFPFTIELDSTANQMVGVPIYIERTSAKTFTLHATVEEASTYNFSTGKTGQSIRDVDINSVWMNNEPFVHENLKFRVKFNEPFEIGNDAGKYYFVIHDLGAMTEAYTDNLDIKPIARDSKMVEISLEGEVPDKEIAFINTLLDEYLKNEVEKRTQRGLKTIEFIDQQLAGVSSELKSVEASLESFRSANNILDISKTAENLSENLERLETDRSKLDIKLKYYESIANSLNSNNLAGIESPSTFGLEDPLLNSMLMELSKMNQERTGLKYSTKEGNPVTEVLDLKIANHKKSLLENVNSFIGATNNALRDLDNKIAKVEATVSRLPGSERQMVNIQRRFEFNDNVYQYLLEKRAEAGIALASNNSEKTIIDRAKQIGQGPISPNRRLILIAAVCLSFIFAFGVIIARDFFTDHITSVEELEQITVIPHLGSIAHGTRRDRSSTIVAHSKNEIGESFRSLRVNLQYLTQNLKEQVIGVTSSIGGEGKTFCSINLAASLALSGRRTVIIDADMRKPRVASQFHLKNDVGLSTYLIGHNTLDEVVQRTLIEGLDVITSGPIPPNPLDLIALPSMEELINELKQEYDTIIIDSPPVGYVSEYIILMKHTNSNIYVVRAGYTSKNHLEKINRLYKDHKIKNVSILLNDARTPMNGYRYTYS
ncbi:MAG TPA: polysaccharide biosynthesis tyrosine autokinase [Cyclobacteriaceae bacterium]|nr:polysaccharide biosynthesis tyrosine autokinase [Cyclobacteriaceae bacterium]